MFTNVLRYLDPEQLQKIEEVKFPVRFAKGETIFKQGAPLTHVLVINTGLLKVYLEDKEQHSIIIRLVKSGEIVGGPGFHTDYRHHFSLTALEETEAFFIDVMQFENCLLQNATFAIKFISYLNRGHIGLYNKLRVFEHKHMNGRMAATLLYLSEDIYENDEFETELSRQDLADMSAMTKESSIRIIKNFKDSGIIECNNNSFKLLNKPHMINIMENG